MDRNQNSLQASKESRQLALKDSPQSRDRLDELLAGCFVLQKMYGRAPESMEAITILFHRICESYPAEKVIKAFERWLETSTEFPTPADIIGLIKRNGRPPLKESDIIAIRKKDGELRTPDDWKMLRQWEAQQLDEWAGDEAAEQQKVSQLLKDNESLRKQLRAAYDEIRRLGDLIQAIRNEKPPEDENKISKTIDYMKSIGAPQSDIDDFITMHAQSHYQQAGA